jgi:acyl-CoA dehydrogenase
MSLPTQAIPDSRGINLFNADSDAQALFALYLPRDLYSHLEPHFKRLGELAGDRLDALASLADKNPPMLSVRSRRGEDESRVLKHPSYVEMERLAYADFGLAALSHRGGVLGWPEPMPPAAKYALTYLFVQAEFGLCCPVSMTDSLSRTLRKFGSPELVERFLPALTSLDFDELKQGAMFMTEQAAGSDVSATETVAELNADGRWALTGEKWFCSNADADFAMVLAKSEASVNGLKGISLFLLPRDLSDGTHNSYRILRLKDKLGTRSMASGEIRLEGASAWLIGERGQGFKLMTDMINNSRLSNGVRAAGLMRRALTEALYIAQHRMAFGKRLIDMPLMQKQLLKMTVWTEQARTMVFQTAKVLEAADRNDANAKKLARIMTPLIKFRACRDARKVTGDAMEVRGGCGYIEEWSDARLLRDAHLGSIWEGTSNIVALDVLRAIGREGCLPVLKAYVDDLLVADSSTGGSAAIKPLTAIQHLTIERAFSLAANAVDKPQLARQVASALYHVVTLAGMRWEAQQSPATGQKSLSHRAVLADLIFEHRLSARDPLHDDADVSSDQALLLLRQST